MKTQSSKKISRTGFAFAEFAIVLVVVGLLVAAVFKGRAMITNVKIKRIEDDFARVYAAIDSYKERYGALPGDDPAAASRFPGTWLGSDNGNGNGHVAGGWNSNDNNAESRKIWKHLRAAGLIAGPVDNTDESYQQPRNSFDGLLGIDFNLFNLGGHNIVFGEIPGDIALILEARGDDGIPSRGRIQAHSSQTTYVTDTRYDVAFRQ